MYPQLPAKTRVTLPLKGTEKIGTCILLLEKITSKDIIEYSTLTNYIVEFHQPSDSVDSLTQVDIKLRLIGNLPVVKTFCDKK